MNTIYTKKKNKACKKKILNWIKIKSSVDFESIDSKKKTINKHKVKKNSFMSALLSFKQKQQQILLSFI